MDDEDVYNALIDAARERGAWKLVSRIFPFTAASRALDAVEAALLNGQVIHDGNPVMTWCAANAVTVSDDAENRKLSKEKATGRIDLMVAAVMGAGVALARAKAPEPKYQMFVI